MIQENKDQLQLPLKADWLVFEDDNKKVEDKDTKIDSVPDSLPTVEDQDFNDNIDKNDSSDLQKQIEILTKQQKDTQNWGRKQRQAYMVTKKRIEDLSKKMFDEGTLFEDDLNEIKAVFDTSFETEDTKEFETSDNPYTDVVNNLTTTLEEYKKWNTDKEADLKFQAFFKHLELVTPKKLKDIQDYLLTEEPKEALKYILDQGDKYYNKFYKQVMQKGDAFSYIEELTNKNEKLEKRVKDLQEELDQTGNKVYSKGIKARGSVASTNKPFESKWGATGNFFDN